MFATQKVKTLLSYPIAPLACLSCDHMSVSYGFDKNSTPTPSYWRGLDPNFSWLMTYLGGNTVWVEYMNHGAPCTYTEKVYATSYMYATPLLLDSRALAALQKTRTSAKKKFVLSVSSFLVKGRPGHRFKPKACPDPKVQSCYRLAGGSPLGRCCNLQHKNLPKSILLLLKKRGELNLLAQIICR